MYVYNSSTSNSHLDSIMYLCFSQIPVAVISVVDLLGNAHHPDGEKSQIISMQTNRVETMHSSLSKHYEEELAFLVLVGRIALN